VVVADGGCLNGGMQIMWLLMHGIRRSWSRQAGRLARTTHIVCGDSAGGVAGDELDEGWHGPVDELLLRPEHASCTEGRPALA
jgi:hypothetical protein